MGISASKNLALDNTGETKEVSNHEDLFIYLRPSRRRIRHHNLAMVQPHNHRIHHHN